MKKAWQLIVNIGITDELRPDEKRSVKLVNKICVFLVLLAVLSIVINILLGTLFFVAALSIALALLFLTYFLNYKKFYCWAKINTIAVVVGLLMFMSLKGGYGSGLEYYFLSLIALPFFLFTNRKLIYLFQFIFVACLLIQKFYSFTDPVDTSSVPHLVFYVVNCLGSAVLVILAMVFFKNLTLKNELELYKKTRIIEANNKQLNEINKQLDFFTYSVSHDLKAPLRIIGSYSELLAKESAGKFVGDEKRYVDGISNNTRRMRNLIESLLMFSHSTKKELSIKETDINQIANEVLSHHKAEIEKYRTKVILNPLPKIQADPDLLVHVLENLISNAIKYSHKKPDPKIEIGCSADDQNITYYIKDNGEGFDMKEAGQLFKPFQRLHSSSEFEGSGIGLSIAKNIIQRHGGKIWVETKEGEGATFYFSFPKEHKEMV